MPHSPLEARFPTFNSVKKERSELYSESAISLCNISNECGASSRVGKNTSLYLRLGDGVGSGSGISSMSELLEYLSSSSCYIDLILRLRNEVRHDLDPERISKLVPLWLEGMGV